MRANALTLLVQEINALIDTGRYDDISITEVKEHIKRGAVLAFLRDRAGKDIDLSIHFSNTYGDFRTWYGERLESIYNAYSGDERKKWGVEHRGLCLLIAWTVEIIKQEGTNLDWSR